MHLTKEGERPGTGKSRRGLERKECVPQGMNLSASLAKFPKVALQPPGRVTLGMLLNLSDSHLIASKIIMLLPSECGHKDIII